MMFKFLHAADLHLDSPLLGLSSRSADYAARIDRASREAFEKLVALAIDEGCSFMVLAGDIFDGDLRNFETGLFFVDQMRRLEAAGIQAFLILGNHDAENRFAARLAMSGNVHVFDNSAAESVDIEALGVTIHGRSFPRRDVTENIARDYPPAARGRFNIGVLHTACQGSEAHHAPYAPCSVEQLANHGYDYWALGHVHARSVLSTDPHIVYPGNLQGRSVRETGDKGASLVTVVDGQVTALDHHPLDVVRWAVVELDAAGLDTRAELLETLRAMIEAEAQEAGDRDLAIRVRIVGETRLHHALVIDPPGLREDVTVLLATIANDIWLEKLVVATQAPATSASIDPTVAGRLAAEIGEMGDEEICTGFLEARLAEIRAKMPAGAHVEAVFETMRCEVPARARTLALALIEQAEAGDAAR